MKRLALIFLAVLIAGPAFAQTKSVSSPIKPPVELNGPCLPIDSRPQCQAGGASAAAVNAAAPTASAQLQALWQKIVSASSNDLTYAAAMAKVASTPASGVRGQCWNAIITLNQQANGANVKNADGTPMARPDPHLFTDAESLAEIIDNLSPQGPLFTSCAGAAKLAQTDVLTLVNAVVTGAAGMAALPAGVLP